MDFDFFEPQFGKTDQLKWHFNQDHDIIFGINHEEIYNFPWEEANPFIKCYTEDSDLVD